MIETPPKSRIGHVRAQTGTVSSIKTTNSVVLENFSYNLGC